MKKRLNFIFVLSLLFFSCRKDPMLLSGLDSKTFVYECKSTDPELSCSRWLTLYPKGKAEILPGGDIVERASYSVNGKKLTVRITDKWAYQFLITSPNELKLEDNGEIWKADMQ